MKMISDPPLPATAPSSPASKDEKPNSTTSSSNNIFPSMTQSTIYKRHQARVLKNMEKQGDPRPAVIRVLSGLPGFRVMIPPYDPSTNIKSQQQQQQHQPAPLVASLSSSSSSSPGAAFESGHDDTTTTILSGVTTSDSNTNIRQQQPSHDFQPLNVILAAGVVGATAEALQGKTTTKGPNNSAASPFHVMKSKGTGGGAATEVPFVQQQGGMSVFKFHNQYAHSSSSSSSASTTTKPLQMASKSQLYAGAATASVLFGTKAIVSRCLEGGDEQQHQQQEVINNNPLSFILSSATAGAMVAVVNAIPSSKQAATSSTASTTTRLLRMPMSATLVSTLPRHMGGATIYFSSFEIIQSFLSNQNNNNNNNQKRIGNKKSVTKVAFSGAVAGALYQSVLCYNNHNRMDTYYRSSTSAAGTTTSTLRLMAPTVLRVAPAHALLFVAYEWVQGNH